MVGVRVNVGVNVGVEVLVGVGVNVLVSVGVGVGHAGQKVHPKPSISFPYTEPFHVTVAGPITVDETT